MKPGQWYRTRLGRRLEIVAFGPVDTGAKDVQIVAYRYEGREYVHMRMLELARDWKLEIPVEVGSAIQYKQVSGVSLGGAEPKRVTYVSPYRVVWTIHSSSGDLLGEGTATREVFDQEYEVVPE